MLDFLEGTMKHLNGFFSKKKSKHIASMYGIFTYFYQKQYTKMNALSVCQVRCVRIFQVGYELILGRWVKWIGHGRVLETTVFFFASKKSPPVGLTLSGPLNLRI